MDAMFNVFGFGMSSPEDKYKFFAQKKEQNIAAQKEKQSLWGSRKTYPKKEGYYAEKQKLLEDKYRTIPVSGGKADMTIDKKTQNIAGASLPFQTPPGVTLDKASPNKVYKDSIMRGGKGANVPNDLNWWQKLSGMFNSKFDLEGAKADWTKKGGFEGLMANPAFTMGLAFMQAGAEGKTLGAGALDNVMKAGGISMHYKKIIEDRAGDPVTEVTTGQMDSIKGVLKSIGTDKPGWWRKIMPGNQSEMYEQAVEDVAFKVQKKVGDMKKAAKKSGRKIEVGTRLYKKIIKEMMESGEIQSKGGVKIGGYQIIDKTLEAKAQGGPVQAGKPYVVGEKGPEVVVPKADANVVSNDDSQVMGMLLASNPQLQNVSRPRAESILRSRFPDYFA